MRLEATERPSNQQNNKASRGVDCEHEFLGPVSTWHFNQPVRLSTHPSPCSSHFQFFARRSSSKPKSSKKPASSLQKQYLLKEYAEQTLGSGNLRLAVHLPEGEDLNEWLAVNSKLKQTSAFLVSMYFSFVVHSVLHHLRTQTMPH